MYKRLQLLSFIFLPFIEEIFLKDKEIVRKGFNEIALKYHAERNEELAEMKLLPDFVALISQGGKILDAGCGGGYPFTELLSEHFDVLGVDISEKQIELAKKNAPKANFQCIDMTKLSFPDEYFNGIFSYYAIIHIPRDEHFDLLVNFYRMLKPNGVALLTFHSEDDPSSYYDDFFDTNMFWSGFDAEKNIQMVKKAGFKIIWSKLIGDSLGDSKHLFVLLEKKQK